MADARTQRKLNVGCGNDIRPAADGWVNMDYAALPGVDVVHDVLEFPWPFADGSFDHLYASHVMEHIPHYLGPKHKKDGFVLVMEEFHRILRPGGTVEILSPHFESADAWADPTHTRVVHPENFRYFSPDYAFNYYSPVRFRVREVRIEGRTVSGSHYLPMGKRQLGIWEHVAVRLPFLRALVRQRPRDLRVVLERV